MSGNDEKDTKDVPTEKENVESSTFTGFSEKKVESHDRKERFSLEKKFICRKCKYSFHYNYDLEVHLLKSHIDMKVTNVNFVIEFSCWKTDFKSTQECISPNQ